jgi:dolichol-phosphate mannosyltransferase
VSLGHDLFKIHEMVSKLVAIAIVTLWNFWINLKLSWRVTQIK